MGSIKNKQIIPDQKHPFQDCKLGREKYADILTNIITNYSDGFVLAIDSEWGAGKTTFVRMWEQKLKNEEFNTIYFNAWEHDFENDALVALISEIKTLIKGKDDSFGAAALFDEIVNKGAKLAKKIPTALLRAAISKYFDRETLEAEILDTLVDGFDSIFQEQIEQYTQKKEGLIQFKEALQNFVTDVKGQKPIIFFIDELDRCRPNYAVEVLEKVKHFFSVDNIVFVLVIDKEQLGHAVRGVYGSDEINAPEYLRRFIDLEYSIPEPDTESFCNYIYEKLDFGYIANKGLNNENDPKGIIHIARHLFDIGQLSLRQQEKVFVQARVAMLGGCRQAMLLVFLIYIKMYRKSLYLEIKSGNKTLEDLQKDYYEIFPIQQNRGYINTIVELEAQLLFFYWKYRDRDNESLFIKDDPERNLDERYRSRQQSSSDLQRNLIGLSNNYGSSYNILDFIQIVDFTEQP